MSDFRDAVLCIIKRPITPSTVAYPSRFCPHHHPAIIIKTTAHENERRLVVSISRVCMLPEALPLNDDVVGAVELVPALDAAEDVALVPACDEAGVEELVVNEEAVDAVTDIVEAVTTGTVVVLLAPNTIALPDMVGFVVNTNVELLLVMVHCVVTAGLLAKVIVVDPEGTTHSVLLLVADGTIDITGVVIVVTEEEVDKLNSGCTVRVLVL
jgi:hypothetical protein